MRKSSFGRYTLLTSVVYNVFGVTHQPEFADGRVDWQKRNGIDIVFGVHLDSLENK